MHDRSYSLFSHIRSKVLSNLNIILYEIDFLGFIYLKIFYISVMAKRITDINRSLYQPTTEPLSPCNSQHHIHNQSLENNSSVDLNIPNDRENSQSIHLRSLLLERYGSFMEDIRRRGCVLIRGYTNDFTQVRVQCNFKHIFDITSREVHRNNWCPICTEKDPFDLRSVDLLPIYNGLSE